MTEPLLIANSKEPIYLLPKMANRHGLIAGATGHRQDRHAASDGRALQRHRCAGIHGRCQRRSGRHQPERRRQHHPRRAGLPAGRPALRSGRTSLFVPALINPALTPLSRRSRPTNPRPSPAPSTFTTCARKALNISQNIISHRKGAKSAKVCYSKFLSFSLRTLHPRLRNRYIPVPLLRLCGE